MEPSTSPFLNQEPDFSSFFNLFPEMSALGGGIDDGTYKKRRTEDVDGEFGAKFNYHLKDALTSPSFGAELALVRRRPEQKTGDERFLLQRDRFVGEASEARSI